MVSVSAKLKLALSLKLCSYRQRQKQPNYASDDSVMYAEKTALCYQIKFFDRVLLLLLLSFYCSKHYKEKHNLQCHQAWIVSNFRNFIFQICEKLNMTYLTMSYSETCPVTTYMYSETTCCVPTVAMPCTFNLLKSQMPLSSYRFHCIMRVTCMHTLYCTHFNGSKNL